MLDRPNPARLAPESLVQHVPLPPQASLGFDLCHVAGEDAPFWLAAGFAMVGALMAAASAAAWHQGRPDLIQTPLVAALPAGPPRPDPSQQPASPAMQERQPTPSMPQPTPEPAKTLPGATDAATPVTTPVPIAAAPSATAPMPDRKMPASECFDPLSIPFERGSARPAGNDMRKLLSSLRPWLSRHGEAVVLIEGHADASGTEDLNVLLSYSRAKAIAGLLKNEGIPAQRITIRAAGSGEAVGRSATLASDRNAVLRIAGVEDCGNLAATTKAP